MLTTLHADSRSSSRPVFTIFFTPLFTYKGVKTQETPRRMAVFSGSHWIWVLHGIQGVLVIDTRRGGKAALVMFATCMACVRGPWVPASRVARQGRDCTFPP